jgi:dephospho-CoA kinase
MIKVGLTGGIGSGKSLIAKIFSTLGIPVFNADTVARDLVTKDNTVREEIIELLGNEAFVENEYNRSFVASQVFNNKELLQKLNAIIHPAALKAFDQWAAQVHAPYLIKEAAILFESGSYRSLDKVITVSAPAEIRVKRVIARDKVSDVQVLARINAQLSDAEREKLSDYVILNDNIKAVLPQVLRIHNELITKR